MTPLLDIGTTISLAKLQKNYETMIIKRKEIDLDDLRKPGAIAQRRNCYNTPDIGREK